MADPFSALAESLSVSLAQIVKVTVVAVLVYAAAIVLLRAGKTRVLGKNTALDVILGFILGSTLSRSINGDADLVPTLAGGLVLVLLHAGAARIALAAPSFGTMVKGRSDVIIRDGRVDHEARRQHLLSENDLAEGLRMQGVEDPNAVRLAHFERNGDISVVRR